MGLFLSGNGWWIVVLALLAIGVISYVVYNKLVIPLRLAEESNNELRQVREDLEAERERDELQLRIFILLHYKVRIARAFLDWEAAVRGDGERGCSPAQRHCHGKLLAEIGAMVQLIIRHAIDPRIFMEIRRDHLRPWVEHPLVRDQLTAGVIDGRPIIWGSFLISHVLGQPTELADDAIEAVPS